jgi:hypothetical protein
MMIKNQEILHMSEIELVNRRDADYHSRITVLESSTDKMHNKIERLDEQYQIMCSLLSNTKTEVVGRIDSVASSIDSIRTILDKSKGGEEAKKGLYDLFFKIISALPILAIIFWAIIQANKP